MSSRRRELRDRFADDTYVLGALGMNIRDGATFDEVRELFGVKYETLRSVTRCHGDELAADGWDPQAQTFSHRAVIRVALLLRPSTSSVSARIHDVFGLRALMSEGARAAKTRRHKAAKVAQSKRRETASAADMHIKRCQTLIDQASKLVTQVRDEDPLDVWMGLDQLDGYDLRAMTMTLAALVPDGLGGLGAWLRDIKPPDFEVDKPKSERAVGLSVLVPAREIWAA